MGGGCRSDGEWRDTVGTQEVWVSSQGSIFNQHQVLPKQVVQGFRSGDHRPDSGNLPWGAAPGLGRKAGLASKELARPGASTALAIADCMPLSKVLGCSVPPALCR